MEILLAWCSLRVRRARIEGLRSLPSNRRRAHVDTDYVGHDCYFEDNALLVSGDYVEAQCDDRKIVLVPVVDIQDVGDTFYFRQDYVRLKVATTSMVARHAGTQTALLFACWLANWGAELGFWKVDENGM